jgi:hypothetical protein
MPPHEIAALVYLILGLVGEGTLMSGWIHSLFGRSVNTLKEKRVSDQRPFTYQFLIERWADGLKVLGAGNGAGLLASGASLQFFANKPELFWIKVGAGFSKTIYIPVPN